MPDTHDSEATGRPVFSPTRWSLVLRARGESPAARAALGELCEAYWTPVFRFLRREGRDDDAARELAQEFFAHVLAGDRLSQADPTRGRFRSYLLGAVRHFLSDRRERAGRLKRGGAATVESLDAADVPVLADPATPLPDAVFDREWALALMARALDLVAAEFTAAGRAAPFEALKPWLAGGQDIASQADVAARLHVSEGALKVAIHRLRRRFREAVLGEIRQTLPDGADPGEELAYLVEVLGRR
jgi:DNA-directed RNA polymerase specialized sigma24 family protein